MIRASAVVGQAGSARENDAPIMGEQTPEPTMLPYNRPKPHRGLCSDLRACGFPFVV